MPVFKAIPAGILSVIVSATIAVAQGAGPAEAPPSGFTGTQYVDSRGCVFSRASLNGQQVWVPRVTSQRKPVCGYQPSFAQAANTASPARRQVARLSTHSVPRGYQHAWTDGRLNTNRAKGTARGTTQMSTIWTETVPRKLVNPDDPAHLQPRTGVTTARASSKGRAEAPAAKGRFVQVAAFGAQKNLQSTASRLRQLGLPVATAQGESGTTLIFAGPFQSDTDVNSALLAVRKAGYRDAFVRK